MVDSTLAFNILARDQGASSVFDKVARSADKTSASLAKTGSVSASVAKASEALTKAHNSESTALDKVQVAEARLSDLRSNAKAKADAVKTAETNLLEVRRNSNSKTSEIAAAESKLANVRNSANTSTTQVISGEKALAKARRDAAAAGNVAQKASKDLGAALDDEGKKAGKSLGSSLKTWFTGDGKNIFKHVGEDGGTVFGSGLLGALKTPVLGPAIIATVGAVVTTVMPAIGAMAGGLLVTGFGAGIAALGLVFAAKSDVVGAKWSKMLSGMGRDMTLLSKPFESTLLDIADSAQRTFNNFKPALGRAFSDLAGPIGKFADDAGRALDRLIPSIAPITAAFSGILASLGGALPGAVQTMSDGFIRLANSVAENPQALADTVTGLAGIVSVTTDAITSLNNINTEFANLTGGTSLVTVALKALEVTVGVLLAPFAALDNALRLVGLKSKDVGAAQDISAQSTTLWTQGLSAAQVAALGVGGAAAGAAGHVMTLAEKTQAAKQAAADITTKLNDWISAMFRVQGLALSLSGAQIGLQAAIDAASASIKANGKAHDINTEKGRNNKLALDAVANATNVQTEAMLRSKTGIAKAAGAAEASKANFITLAQKMGFSAGEARKMAREMIAIPNVTREAKLKADKADLEAKLKAARTALADPKLTATKKAKLEATIASLLSQVNTAQGKIDSLHGKTVGITVKYTSTGVPTNVIGSEGRRAKGGPVKKNTPYWVGEEGPELMVPDGNGTVIPNGGSTPRGTALTSAGGQEVTVRLVVDGSDSRTARLIKELLRFEIQTSHGGNVQQALGG